MQNLAFERGRKKAQEHIESTFDRANKQTVTFIVKRDIWRGFRIQCLEDGKSAAATVGALIADYLERRKAECKS